MFRDQRAFMPFVFDTFEFLAQKIIDLLQEIQSLMNNNLISHKSMNIVFKRIDFAI